MLRSGWFTSFQRRMFRLASHVGAWSIPRNPRTARRSRKPGIYGTSLEVLESRQVPSAIALHVAGNQIQDSAGHVVQLQGVNVDAAEGWGRRQPNQGLTYDQDVRNAVETGIQTAISWHANLIRLPMNQDFWLGLDPNVSSAGYRADIDTWVKQASDAGVHVMLVDKVSDGGTGNPALQSGDYSLPDNNTTAFWKSIAEHYASNPAVMFDLFNEPGHYDATFSQWKNGASNYSENVGGHQVTYNSPGMQGLINSIRGIPGGCQNIITLEGLNYGHEFGDIATSIVQGTAVQDSAGQLIYSAHLYPGSIPDAAITSTINHLLPSSVTSHYPMYIGEWGDDVNPGLEGGGTTDAKTWNQNFLKWLSTEPYSWSAWAINAPPWLNVNNSSTPTPYFGQLVKDYLTSHVPQTPSSPTVTFQHTDYTTTLFRGDVTITNSSNTAIQGWTLQFDFTGSLTNNPDPSKLTNVWNARIVSHIGNHYVIQNDNSDATIAAGKSITFGFIGNWAPVHVAPTNYVVNGPVPAVKFQNTNYSGTLFRGDVTITNNFKSAIQGWSLEFDFTGTLTNNPDPNKLTNIWNAIIVSHVGNHYVIRNDSTDATIAAGQSITFGFIGNWASVRTAPTNFVLDGPVPTVKLQTTSYSGSLFRGDVTITNNSNTAIQGWTLEFDFTGTITNNPDPNKWTNIWNATIVSHVGNHYVIQGTGSTATIGAGQSITFGFIANWASVKAVPTNFKLNGLG